MPNQAENPEHSTDGWMKAKGPSICVCVMVKNEAHVLPRLIHSIQSSVPVGRWLFYDTGSTDRTIQVIRELMEASGETYNIHLDQWVDFGHNRSAMLELARGSADYLMLVDADWTIELTDGAIQAQVAAQLMRNEACYLVPGVDHGLDLVHKVFVRGDLPWYAEGPAHEYIDLRRTPGDGLGDFVWANMSGLRFVHHADGARNKDGNRSHKDLEALIRKVNETGDPRWQFYLANTYKDLGLARSAYGAFRERMTMEGFYQERVVAAHYSAILAGELPEFTVQEQIGLYLEAWNMQPTRLETLYDLLQLLRNNQYHVVAWTLAGGLPNVNIGLGVPDGLFSVPWVYEYGIAFEYGLAAYYGGNRVIARQAFEHVIERAKTHQVPLEFVEQSIANLSFCIDAQEQEEQNRHRDAQIDAVVLDHAALVAWAAEEESPNPNARRDAMAALYPEYFAAGKKARQEGKSRGEDEPLNEQVEAWRAGWDEDHANEMEILERGANS